MMDHEIQFRQLKALREALDQPFFDQAVRELMQEMAVEIADCVGNEPKANGLRAERFALKRLRDRLTSYTDELLMIEKKTEHKNV